MGIIAIILLVLDIRACFTIYSRSKRSVEEHVLIDGTYYTKVIGVIIASILCNILILMIAIGDDILLYDMTVFYVFTIALSVLIEVLLYLGKDRDKKARKLQIEVEEMEKQRKLAKEEEERKKQERHKRIAELAKQQGCYYTLNKLYEERAEVLRQYALESLTGFQLYEKKESATINGVVGSKLGGPVLGAAAYASSSLRNNAVDAYNEGVRKNNIATDIKVKGLKARLDELDKKISEMEEEILRKENAE